MQMIWPTAFSIRKIGTVPCLQYFPTLHQQYKVVPTCFELYGNVGHCIEIFQVIDATYMETMKNE
ncbi:hypothetical protein, partial [Shewanella sp. ALD9]|uniref:hypothetical protein n=1 Tax=Shewanella sp. ALD9 TaxID=2058330 RepID=UPI001A8DFF02